jgi:membrane protein
MRFLSPKQIAQCFGRGLITTINHDGIEHAGYLAFLSLLAIFPFLVFIVAVIGVIGQGEAGAILITRILELLPQDITIGLRPRVVEIISGPPQGLLTISILGAIWTASSAVEGMRTILNRAYHVATPPAYWLRRSLSIAQLLVFTFVAVTALLLVVAFPLVFHGIERLFGFNLTLPDKDAISRIISLSTMGVLFIAVSSLYYFIPNTRQRVIALTPGALVVVLGWMGSAYVFTLYLSNFNQVNLIYGSLGGIIAALIFFYICNMIFIFGAEFNYQLLHELGARIVEREKVSPTVPAPLRESPPSPSSSKIPAQ